METRTWQQNFNSNPQSGRDFCRFDTDFTAAVRSRKELRRIEPAVGIENTPHTRHGSQIGFVEEKPDVGLFFQAYAVLACDAAAELDTGAQSSGSRFDDSLQFTGSTHIEQNIGMQVTVPSVKNVSNT